MQLLTSLVRLLQSKTARNTYFIFAGNSFAMIFAFVFTVTLARLISLSDFGYFSALLSFLLITSDIADFGIGSSLPRFLPAMEKELPKLYSFLKTAFVIQLIIALTIMGLAIGLSPILSKHVFHESTINSLVKITAVGIFGTIIVNFFQFTLLARQRFIAGSIYSFLGTTLRLLGLLILFIFSFVTLTSSVLAQVGGIIITASIGLVLLGVDFLKHPVSRQNAKKLIAFSKYLGVARGLTAVAGRLDVLMIIALTNSTEAGLYSIASRVISIYPLLTGSFSSVIAPKIASLQNQKELRSFTIKVSLATVGVITTILFLILIADPFLTTLFGEKAAPAVGVFRVLLISMIFFVASLPAVSLVLYYLKKPYILTINSILQVIIVIGGNIIFIPLFGRYGAAYSLIAAYGSTLFLTSGMCWYLIKTKHAPK